MIAASAARNRRGKFDAWPTHGYFQYFTIVQGFSALYYPVGVFGLVDGFEHNYFVPLASNFDDAYAYLLAVENFQVSGHPGNWVGEGFNFQMRQDCIFGWLTDLADPTAFTNWYLSH